MDIQTTKSLFGNTPASKK